MPSWLYLNFTGLLETIWWVEYNSVVKKWVNAASGACMKQPHWDHILKEYIALFLNQSSLLLIPKVEHSISSLADSYVYRSSSNIQFPISTLLMEIKSLLKTV
jgi:hypothetical protein